MKILLLGINARFTHVNLALYYLRQYIDDITAVPFVPNDSTHYPAEKHTTLIVEKTIDDNVWDIISDIFRVAPDVLCLSAYIWNQSHIQIILGDIKKVLPKVKIICGGPDISWNAKEWLEKYPSIDFIIQGAGEKAFVELINEMALPPCPPSQGGSRDLSVGTHLCCPPAEGNSAGGQHKCVPTDMWKSEISATEAERTSAFPTTQIIKTQNYHFSEIKFPYKKDDRDALKHRYVYYEASRGCPFQCSYCLSPSSNQKLEYKNFDTIKKELDYLLDFEPIIIKFIDRSFNVASSLVQTPLYPEILNYISSLKTETKFHFEIHPLYITEEFLHVLRNMPKDRVQLEIGIQSIHDKTLKHINRAGNWNDIKIKLSELLELKNIHNHFDMIVGLPNETLSDIKESFNEIVRLKPDHFQLGFLKILPGTQISKEIDVWGYKYQEKAPYRVFSSNSLKIEEMKEIELVELVLELVYNSGIMPYFSRTVLSFVLNDTAILQTPNIPLAYTNPPLNINILQTAEGNSAGGQHKCVPTERSLEPPCEGGQGSLQTPYDYFLTLGIYFKKNNINKSLNDKTKIFKATVEHFESVQSIVPIEKNGTDTSVPYGCGTDTSVHYGSGTDKCVPYLAEGIDALSIFFDCLVFDWFLLSKTHYYPDFFNAKICDNFKETIYKEFKEKWQIGQFESGSFDIHLKNKYKKLKNVSFFSPLSEEFKVKYLNNALGVAKVDCDGIYLIYEDSDKKSIKLHKSNVL